MIDIEGFQIQTEDDTHVDCCVYIDYNGYCIDVEYSNPPMEYPVHLFKATETNGGEEFIDEFLTVEDAIKHVNQLCGIG